MTWQSSLNAAIKNLRAEEQNLERDLGRVREAIHALGGLGRGGKRGSAPSGSRRLSPAGREAIAKAARKRWAKWRAQQKA
jgi:hypothetical protein